MCSTFPQRKLFGGNLGLSITVPAGHVAAEATVNIHHFLPCRARSMVGALATSSADAVGLATRRLLPHRLRPGGCRTGRWEAGFSPIVGFVDPASIPAGPSPGSTNRPSCSSMARPASRLTSRIRKQTTSPARKIDFEWANGREVATLNSCWASSAMTIVRSPATQVAGATLGPLKSSVDAIGAGISYTTAVRKTPLVLNLRHYNPIQRGEPLGGQLDPCFRYHPVVTGLQDPR